MKAAPILASASILAALLSSVAVADRPNPLAERRGPAASITVSVNGLSCTTSAGAGAFAVNSWSWGATNTSSSTGSGGGSGRVDIGDLMIKKNFDACSSALFGAVTNGRAFRTLALVQRDRDGNTVANVELSNVVVSSWTVGGSARDASPDETVSFQFTEVCISGAGAARLCYDLRTGTTR
jgi:type VI secretion system secreted protein Hcp